MYRSELNEMRRTIYDKDMQIASLKAQINESDVIFFIL